MEQITDKELLELANKIGKYQKKTHFFNFAIFGRFPGNHHFLWQVAVPSTPSAVFHDIAENLRKSIFCELF